MSVRPSVSPTAYSSSTSVFSSASSMKIPSAQEINYLARISFLYDYESSLSSFPPLYSGIIYSVLPLSFMSFLCAISNIIRA